MVDVVVRDAPPHAHHGAAVLVKLYARPTRGSHVLKCAFTPEVPLKPGSPG